MRFLIFLTACLILSPASARAGNDDADITIYFGSYCCGTDVVTEDKIMDYLKFSDQIRSWKKSDDVIGKEGEHALEINLIGGADREQIYDDLKEMIPRYSDKAPTAIKGKGLPTFQTGMSPQEEVKKK